ncbi:response regulator [Ammoniphilus resinae]|uniref:Two-component SAPR family response regulator n=1 Tax=Ammoniphilus resinae TaxID=861532 RepID=A0ABS4GIX2_9BACL|nr:response regulator [Ammoniphilus resinae]MBP1930204.1 two-component SAPR family response regulator [Ammoniphilus resinae]
MIHVLLIDDEEHALDILEILLNQMGNLVISGKYTNPMKAIEVIHHTQVDAVFLDIDMPGMKGMDVAKEIQRVNPNIQIIFTTAYAEYAIEAFEIRSLDYLLKPIRMERLADSVNRIQETKTEENTKIESRALVVCMGDFSIHLSNAKNEQIIWRTNKEKELCAFLIHHLGQVVHRDVILEALWPESNVEKARTYLHTCISLLRKNLRTFDLPATVTKTGSGYALDLGDMGCDVRELEELLDQILKGEAVLRPKWMEKLNHLYKADYMDHCDFDWARTKKESLAKKYVQALRYGFLYFKKVKQFSDAIECLHKILELTPESEQDGRELIKLLLILGKRNEAILVYRQLEASVKDQLGVELEEETKRLYLPFASMELGMRS